MEDKIKELIEIRKLTKLEIFTEIQELNKVQLTEMSDNDFNISLAVLEKEYEIFTLVIQDLEELL